MDKVIVQVGRKFWCSHCMLPESWTEPKFRMPLGPRPMAARFTPDKGLALARQLLSRCSILAEVMNVDNEPTAEDLFLEYKDMAIRIASRLQDRFDYVTDLEERSLSHLSILITELWDDYDEKRANRNTWIYNSIKWHLQNIAATARNRKEKPLGNLDEAAVPRNEELDEKVDGVSVDAKFILDIIRDDPDGMMRRFNLPKHSRPFQEHLVSEYGWEWDRIILAWKELKDVFQSHPKKGSTDDDE